VAVVTRCFGVLADERKVRVTGVVKTRIVPVAGVVTIFALVSAASVMRIVLGMAAETGRWRYPECLVFMAVIAGNFLVLAKQRVVRRAVIKLNFLPVCFTVTIVACRARKALVDIIVPMAGKAVGRCLAVLLFRFMAISTGDFAMTTQQRAVGEIVVKCIFVKNNNRKIPAFMIGVATYAGVDARVFKQAVKTCLSVDVQAHVFVTNDAEIALPCTFKPCVTGRALRFNLGMTLDSMVCAAAMSIHECTIAITNKVLQSQRIIFVVGVRH